jgi:hypothetical protein
MAEPPYLEKLLTPAELGELLGGVSAKTLANWRHTGTGPRFCRAGKIAYDPADVRAWLETRKADSTSTPRP